MPRTGIHSPAKLNLCLNIGGRRPDGFHEIESLFLALAFGDTLFLEPADGADALEMYWQPSSFRAIDHVPQLSPEENIISRAVALFRSHTGYAQALKITVEKRIPVGSGLGGGSSNAAATLLALNRLACEASLAGEASLAEGEEGLLDRATLVELGAALGSDVPFFLHEAPLAWVSGRGELVQPLIPPEMLYDLTFLLVNPGFSSNTAEAFRLLDRYRQNNASLRPPNDVQRQLYSNPPGDWQFSNDFLPVLCAESSKNTTSSDSKSVYQDIIFLLRELGAGFAGLSGSGSTCFGVFSARDRAAAARKALSEHWQHNIETFLLRAGQYSSTII